MSQKTALGEEEDRASAMAVVKTLEGSVDERRVMFIMPYYDGLDVLVVTSQSEHCDMGYLLSPPLHRPKKILKRPGIPQFGLLCPIKNLSGAGSLVFRHLPRTHSGIIVAKVHVASGVIH
jgi:hypothetical protein